MINVVNECMKYFAPARSEAQDTLARKKVAGSYKAALKRHVESCTVCRSQQSMCIVGEALAAGAANEGAKGL
jgi:hypothetical protein